MLRLTNVNIIRLARRLSSSSDALFFDCGETRLTITLGIASVCEPAGRADGGISSLPRRIRRWRHSRRIRGRRSARLGWCSRNVPAVVSAMARWRTRFRNETGRSNGPFGDPLSSWRRAVAIILVLLWQRGGVSPTLTGQTCCPVSDGCHRRCCSAVHSSRSSK